MDILQLSQFYHPHVGGIEQAVKVIAEGCTQRGHDVRVIAAAGEQPAGSTTLNGVNVTKVRSHATLLSVPFCPTLPFHIRKHIDSVDLVHVHLPHPLAVLSLQSLARSDTPTVVTYHSDIVRQAVSGKLYRPLLKRFLTSVDTIVTTSPRLRSSSPVLNQVDECEVVPLAVSSKLLNTPVEPVPLPDGESTPTILFVGRLGYYKGLSYLIDAMKDVEANCLIVGDGEKRETLQRQTNENGLNDKVHFLGRLSDAEVRYCYEHSDVFVLPSIHPSEAFGIVQLEAMAHGLPVVNTNLRTGVPWVSENRKTGLTVPPKDADALSKALSELVADESLRIRLGEAGRTKVNAEFTEEDLVRRTVEMYEATVEK